MKKFADDAVAGKFIVSRKGVAKPEGVWLSVELSNGLDSYNDWRKSENGEGLSFSPDSDYIRLDVELRPGIKLFIIDNMKDLKRITDEFDYPFPPNLFDLNSYDAIKIFDKIRDMGYEGIYLTPRGERETHLTFMYGWDMASVVIFDPSKSVVMKYH
jgi:hypothetical protein